MKFPTVVWRITTPKNPKEWSPNRLPGTKKPTLEKQSGINYEESIRMVPQQAARDIETYIRKNSQVKRIKTDKLAHLSDMLQMDGHKSLRPLVTGN